MPAMDDGTENTAATLAADASVDQRRLDDEMDLPSDAAAQQTPPVRSLSQTLADYNLGAPTAAAAASQGADLPLPPILSLSGGRPREDTLPSISTVTGSTISSTPADSRMSSPLTAATEMSFSPNMQPLLTPTAPTSNPWPSLNPLTAYYTPGHVQQQQEPPPLSMDVDASSTASTGRAPSVSMDDPDVRLAAEALGDLRADFVSSPPSRSSSASKEPLLSLLTTSHPLLAKTIEGTTSAYNSGKNFSPRFKSGAEYVEGYLSPLSHTLGSVSRVTGVEGGVRWFLGGGRRRREPQRSQQQSTDDSSSSSMASFAKRRKVGRRGRSVGSNAGTPVGTPEVTAASVQTPDAASEQDDEDRRLSEGTVETLPAYDDLRSPAYTESPAVEDDDKQPSSSSPPSPPPRPSQQQQQQQQQQLLGQGQPAAWPSRLIMSTSGLSIAMSDESLRSLRYCLNWLRWANGHMDKVLAALKTAVDKYDEQRGDDKADGDRAENGENDEKARTELAARIATLRGDVLHTLKGVVDTVSQYAGGALPDNARVLVRRHLTSLPQRFRLALGDSDNGGGGENGSDSAGGGSDTKKAPTDKEVREGAQRVLVLAREGLDMMAQVSGVLDGTIVSAEEWCERLGKRKGGSGGDGRSSETATATAPAMATATAGDVAMQ